MQWQEQSIILSSKPFSENCRLVSVFNRSMGKTSGLVKGTKSVIQKGDISDVTWKGRNADQLGTFKIETVFSPFSFVFENPLEILAIDSVCTLCSNGLPDRAPHGKLFDSVKRFLLDLVHKDWLLNYVLFEKMFLSEVGVGLSLSQCAVTGKKDGLFYVSPRTGKAVIKEVGEKYKDKLFILPKFLLDADEKPSNEDILMALKITQHFLKIYFCGISSRELPMSRDYLVQRLLKGDKDEAQYYN
ncbi:MAG: DNA repair protein RecO [Alphaproteobacteria bacterium]|nr:DNA repair protein RecO [Alphaproteobacteria bacterium]